MPGGQYKLSGLAMNYWSMTGSILLTFWQLSEEGGGLNFHCASVKSRGLIEALNS